MFLSRIALVLALACAVAQPAAAQGRPAGVATDFVERRQVAETVAVFAQVVGSRDSDVAARVGGVVQTVGVEVGDRVAAGTLLAELDRELLDIELRSAEAALTEARAGIEVARAGVQQAELAFQRVAGLRDTNAFSQGTYDDRATALARATGEMAQAQARLVSAEADVARAAYNSENATIRAPFDAVVLENAIDPGEFIQTGQRVARLLDITALEVEAAVPAQYVANLEEGMKVTGAFSDGAPVRLTVRAILPTESTTTRTRPVRFEGDLSGTGGRVALGQSLTVDVPVTVAREALLVPKDAVAQSRGAWQVFVHKDGKAEPRAVEIGASFGSAFEVLSGLAPGDEVVVRGNERLRPMQDIAPEPVRPRPGSGEAAVPALQAPEEESAVEKASRRQAAIAN